MTGVLAEEYYGKMWASDRWGSRELNQDERLRWQAIRKLIEEFVLPARREQLGLRILDLGCGRGWLTGLLGVYGDTLGVDPLTASIRRARELFPALNFCHGDADALLRTLGPAHFDLIVASEVIEHVKDGEKRDFMRSIYSLLVLGGFAILTTPRGELWSRWRRLDAEIQPVEQWIGESALDRLSQSVGFRIVARDRVYLPGLAYNWITRLMSSRLGCRATTVFGGRALGVRLRHVSGIYQVVLLQTV